MKNIVLSIFVFFTFVIFAQTPRYGGTLVISQNSGPISLDPGHVSGGPSLTVCSKIYDTLVQLKYGTTQIESGLASSWDISKDGLEYTFHLRKGVYFAKTKYFKKSSELTSKDVVFSFKRQFDKNNPYNKIGGPFKYYIAMDMNNIIKDVVALDKYTVKIILKRKESPILANLAMPFASILSKDYADMLLKKGKENNLGKKPVGTGPFKLKKLVKDSKTVLLSNKNYWGEGPYLNKLIYEVITKASVSEAALKRGSIHIGAINLHDLPYFKKNNKFKVLQKAGLNVYYLAFNTQKNPFDNVIVRRAISHAIDSEYIIKTINNGLHKKINTPIPPTMWGYNSDLKGYDYDIKKAKELLKQAGYPNGFKTTIWVSSHEKVWSNEVQAAQAYLKKVGIDAKFVQYDWPTYIEKVGKGEHDMAFLQWGGDNGDPDNFLNILLSKKSAMTIPSENIAFWKNDEFTKLIDEAKKTTNIEKRTKLYKKAQLIFEKEAPWTMMSTSIVTVVMSKKVHGYKIGPVGSSRLNQVWLEK